MKKNDSFDQVTYIFPNFRHFKTTFLSNFFKHRPIAVLNYQTIFVSSLKFCIDFHQIIMVKVLPFINLL